jgi:hypothetical protein
VSVARDFQQRKRDKFPEQVIIGHHAVTRAAWKLPDDCPFIRYFYPCR